MSTDPHVVPPWAPAADTGPAANGDPVAELGAPPAVVAQILATEHWSLLATRSMLWSELMSRISIHLTISSAALVVLALVGQATAFGTGFWIMAIGLSSAILFLGSLTLVRVTVGSLEDHWLVVGMNRLRGAYAELDPSVAGRFVTSIRDDSEGVLATYSFGAPRPVFLAASSSTGFFLACFNAIVAGALAATVTSVAGGAIAVIVTIGLATLVAYLIVCLWASNRLFANFFKTSLGTQPPDRPSRA